MSDTFDPYHKWLGIPPKDQPPNHYRLLGLNPFEEDAAVVENAAEARMRHVKTFASGPRGKLSQKMLNELSTAQSCLLHPKKKAEYDEQLQSEVPVELEPQAPPPLEAPSSLRELPPIDGFESLDSLESLTPVATKSPSFTRSSYGARRRRSHSVLMIVLAGCVAFGLLIAAATVILLVFVLKKPEGEELSSNNSRPDMLGPNRRQDPRTRIRPSVGPSRSENVIDLLAEIDLERDLVSGTITRQSDGSIRTNDKFCRVAINRTVPISYEIVAEVKRLSGSDSVVLGLSNRGRRFTIVVDGFPEYGYRTGVNMVNGHTLVQERNTTSKQGRVLPNGRKAVIRCQVHLERVEVYVDDRLVTSYVGNISRLSLRPQMNIAGQPDLFLATWHTPFEITRLEMRRLDPLEDQRRRRGR